MDDYTLPLSFNNNDGLDPRSMSQQPYQQQPVLVSPLQQQQYHTDIGRPQMPPDSQLYFDPSLQQHPAMRPTPPQPSGSQSMPAPQSSSSSSQAPAPRKRGRTGSAAASGSRDARSSTPPKDGAKDGTAPPSILVREKKQKACANCRRAKLKCIVEGNETDCVRCKARKERCIFYPRGHDEDWQQTLTADLYNAVGHLAQLSQAVHHILDHLTAQGTIPPMSQPLPRFDAPERDLAVLQGWGAEKNRELDGARKRSRRKREDDDDDNDDDNAPNVEPDAGVSGSMAPPNVMRPQDAHLNGIPQGFEQQRIKSSPHSGPMGLHPQGPMGMDVNGMTGFEYLQSPSNTGRSSMSAPPGPPGQTPPSASNMSSISPVDNTFAVSLLDSSSQPGSTGPTGPSTGNSGSGAMVHHSGYNSQQGIFGLLNGARPSPSQNQDDAPVPTFTGDTLGSADPRPNIVKRSVISNNDAMSLVNYFHSKLAPWLFGYRLEFTKFPYIPQGPSVITPFILSVMCLVASERVPSAHQHRLTLAREVTQLLVNSPADSFISTLDAPFGGGTGAKDEEGEEELDPELGIGPEEIIGACILATFMTERDQAATIASSAFKWARGWIKWTSLTVPLPPTLGEVCGLLPIKRDATREDMARVWLLCYIVDGTEALQRDNPAPPRRDPMSYCHVLVPHTPSPGDQYSPHDILLTFHARLITLLREWYHKRSQHVAIAAGTPMSAQAAVHARLASSVNASLEWWRADLESHNLDANWMRYINLFWEFARMLVNATSAKSLGANPRLRAASWAHGVEAAVGFLEKCSVWPNRDELANLPPCYLSMITLAGSVLVDAIKDQGVAECPFQAEDAIPLLAGVADMLSAGGLPMSHVARESGGTLRGFAEQLQRYV